MNKTHHLLGITGMAFVALLATVVLQSSSAVAQQIPVQNNTMRPGIGIIGDDQTKIIPPFTGVVFKCEGVGGGNPLQIILNPTSRVAVYAFSGFETQRYFISGLFRLDGNYLYTTTMYMMNRGLPQSTLQAYDRTRWYAVIGNVQLSVNCSDQGGLWDPWWLGVTRGW